MLSKVRRRNLNPDRNQLKYDSLGCGDMKLNCDASRISEDQFGGIVVVTRNENVVLTDGVERRVKCDSVCVAEALVICLKLCT